MTTELKERLSRLTDSQLLLALAFEQALYLPEALEVLDGLLHSRGYTFDDVLAFRREKLRGFSGEDHCAECMEPVILDTQEFVGGEITCPWCATRQPVLYMEIKYCRDNPSTANPENPGTEPTEEYPLTYREFLHVRGIDKILSGNETERLSEYWLRFRWWLHSWLHELRPSFEIFSWLRGWLIVWQLYFIVSSCIAGLQLMYCIGAGDLFPTLYQLVIVLIYSYVAYVFFNRLRIFPMMAVMSLLARPLLVTAYYVMNELFSLSTEPFEAGIFVLELIYRLIEAIIWIPYLLKSKRIKATFVKG